MSAHCTLLRMSGQNTVTYKVAPVLPGLGRQFFLAFGREGRWLSLYGVVLSVA